MRQPTRVTTFLRIAGLAVGLMCALFVGAGTRSLAHAAQPVLPSADWQARAENVAARVGELEEFGKTYANDDAKLADAVGDLKERTAAKKSAPAWSKKTSWIEGSGADQVYFGVGVFTGAPSNRHLAFVVAENRARVEIARLQNLTVVRKSAANGRSTVTSSTTATLTHVVIVDWYADGSTFYALAAYGKPVTLKPDAPWIP